jgi:hypothetical protein
MPNSFSQDDRRCFKVAAAANSKNEAMQKVCLLAFTHLLLSGPNSVLLRGNHWKVAVSTIRQDAISISGIQTPASGSDVMLDPAPPSRSQQAQSHYEEPLPGDEMAREEKIREILTQMINDTDSGWVDPSCTPKWRLLCRYIPTGGLKHFLQEHDQFIVHDDGDNKWYFSLANPGQT